MNKRRMSLQIALLATAVLLVVLTSMPVASQGPSSDSPNAQRELERGQRAKAPLLQSGTVTGAGSGGHGSIQSATASTVSGPRSFAPVSGDTGVLPIRHEQDEAAYLSAKQAAEQSRHLPAVKSANNDGDSAGPQLNRPNAPQVLPPQGISYQAVGYTGWIPPDPIIAVTPSDVIVAVNSSFYVTDKANPGNLLFSSTFASWFNCCGISLPAGTQIFDPKLVYDFINHRVVMVVLAENSSSSPTKSWFLVSVAQQSSAVGGWRNYAFDATLNGSTSTTNFADYTEIGTDGANLYISTNMYSSGGVFQYVKIRMLKLSELYGGSIASGWWDFWSLAHADSTKAFSAQPAHHYFSGPPMYFISAENNLSTSSGNILTTFEIIPPGSNNWPAVAPSFVRVATITTSNTFAIPVNAQQPGTSTLIDTGDDRILSARYWGGDIWATQGCQNTANSNAGLCVYGVTTGGSKFFEVNGWNSTGFDYYYPSLAADWDENIAIVFSRSSPSEYASIRYTGKRWTDNVNLEGSVLVKSGEDTYVNVAGGRNRWGDYTGIERDPGNDVTFWLFNEYAKPQVSGVGRWSTWIFTVYYPYPLYMPLVKR